MTTYQMQRTFWRTIIYVLLFLMALLFLIPLYIVLVTALKEPIEIRVERAWDFPTHVYWQSFEDAWLKLRSQFQNSLVLTINATALSAVIGSMNGYVLAKWRIPGDKILFPLMLFGMFIPYQAILIPLFKFLSDIGMYSGLPGLILVHVVYGLPITTLIFRNFYVQIPDEIIEASAIDGAGFFSIYTQVVFPLSLPAFVVVIIWQFTQIWNEFLFAVMLTKDDTAPITVPLAELAGGEAVQWNFPMAGAIIAALPTVLVYIIMGRYFIRGLLAGSIKG